MTHLAPMNDSTELHVILGAGQVGAKLAHRLAARGHRVTLVRRSEPAPDVAGITWARGDVTDTAFADEVCRGASVVYGCANPADYTRWGETLVPLYRAVLGAATRAGARFVGLDCLYMLGLPTGPMTEETPMNPHTARGALRAQLVREALDAHERGDVEVTFGRASDFVGPETPLSMFGDRFVRRARAGKAGEVFGDPDLPRSYSYTPDVAEGLAVLGSDPRALDSRVWNLPVLESTTTRELGAALFAAAGHPPKLRRIPSWCLGAAGVFSPLARDMREMLYQWENPFVLDDSKFRGTFGIGPTPLAEAAAETLRALPD